MRRKKQRLLVVCWLILMAIFVAGIFILTVLVNELFLLLIFSVPILSFGFLRIAHKLSFR